MLRQSSWSLPYLDFTPEGLFAENLPIYLGLGQALNMLDCNTAYLKAGFCTFLVIIEIRSGVLEPGSKLSFSDHNMIQQEALLSQRDLATRLSVEILQLQNIAIVWHYLRDPIHLAVFTQYRSVTDTPTQTEDGQIHDDGMYCA